MKLRRLGKTGIKVSEIGFGSYALGGTKWGPQKDSDSLAAINKALDLGCVYFDTALTYGKGHSEKLIGQILKERNCADEIIVSTKVPQKSCGTFPQRVSENIRDAFPKEWILECLEKSLKNLGRNYVDVLQLHAWNETWNGETEWMDTMQELKDNGKIRAFGISLMPRQPNQANKLVAAGKVDTIQVVYNILDQSPEEKLFPLAKKSGTGIIARVPLASGLLTGKWNAETKFPEGDFRQQRYNAEKLIGALQQVESIKRVIGNSMPMHEAALKFCLANKTVSSVIVGSRNEKQADMNFSIANNKKKLARSQLAELKKLWVEKKICS